MKKLIKGMIPTTGLIAILAFGTTFANAGILINSLKTETEQPCTEPTTKVDSGILINSFTGILINSLTGILINSSVDTSTTPTNCGILINS